MAIGIISLVTLVLTIAWGVIKYLNSDKTKIKNLKARQYELEEKLRRALGVNDTVSISSITIELERVRVELKSYSDAK